ncbi:MAG: cytochrome c-type biogenesis protein [Planctomycetota bacterium]
MKRIALALAGAAMAVLLGAASDDPAEHLKSPKQEARAEALFDQIRCMVCQTESIAASEADLAHDMRTLVRQQVGAGKSDKDVLDYMYARYGPAILLRPRLTPGTALLWGGPFAVILAGLTVLFIRRRKGAAPLEPALSKAEIAALKALETNAKEDVAS